MPLQDDSSLAQTAFSEGSVHHLEEKALQPQTQN